MRRTSEETDKGSGVKCLESYFPRQHCIVLDTTETHQGREQKDQSISVGEELHLWCFALSGHGDDKKHNDLQTALLLFWKLCRQHIPFLCAPRRDHSLHPALAIWEATNYLYIKKECYILKDYIASEINPIKTHQFHIVLLLCQIMMISLKSC